MKNILKYLSSYLLHKSAKSQNYEEYSQISQCSYLQHKSAKTKSILKYLGSYSQHKYTKSLKILSNI